MSYSRCFHMDEGISSFPRRIQFIGVRALGESRSLGRNRSGATGHTRHTGTAGAYGGELPFLS